MKDRSYINKVKIIAACDCDCGNKEKLLKAMTDLIKKEDYETCEGIQAAIDEDSERRKLNKLK